MNFELPKNIVNSPFIKTYSHHLNKLDQVFNQLSIKGILGAHAIPCERSNNKSYKFMDNLLKNLKEYHKNNNNVLKRLESIFGYIFYLSNNVDNNYNYIDLGFQAIAEDPEQEKIDMLKIKLVVMSELIYEGFDLLEPDIDIHKRIRINIKQPLKLFSLVYTPPTFENDDEFSNQMRKKHWRLFDNKNYSYISSEYCEYFELIQLTKLEEISFEERKFIAAALYHKHKNCSLERPKIDLLLKVLGLTQKQCDDFKSYYEYIKEFLIKEENLKEYHKRCKFTDDDYTQLLNTLNKSELENLYYFKLH